jgi:acyl-ACP thioesterase
MQKILLEENQMEPFFDQKYSLRYYDINNHGIASPVTMLTLLEEAAAEHCYNIGYDIFSLARQNIGWVYISLGFEMIRYPTYRENITIRTWISKNSLIKCFREYIILDGENNVIGKARCACVFYDIQKRKPVPIFDDIKNKWGQNEKIVYEDNNEIFNSADDGLFNTEYNIFRADIDDYNHVNNIRYIIFLLESMPQNIIDKYFIKTLNARFHSEAKLGEKVQVYINDSLGNNNFLHTMKSNIDNKLLVKIHTQWEKF